MFDNDMYSEKDLHCACLDGSHDPIKVVICEQGLSEMKEQRGWHRAWRQGVDDQPK